MIKKITVADYLTQQINICGRSQKEIAEDMGYDKPNLITMFKQGKTRLPINKVPAAAAALGVDPVHLLRIVMGEYMPDAWEVIENLFSGYLVSNEEKAMLDMVRDIGTGLPLKPETAEEVKEFSDLIKKWKKRYDAHADAAQRRVESMPRNAR